MSLFLDHETEATSQERLPQPSEFSSRHEAVSQIEWSFSRRSTLEQCARRYYNEYFGANKRVAKGEAAKGQLHFLKGLENRFTRTGAILHLAIATYFRKAKLGQVWDADRLVSFAQSIFRADCDYSRNYHTLVVKSADEKYPPKLLLEHYCKQPNADALCTEAGERMCAGLRTFAEAEVYDMARTMGCAPDAYIEKRFKLQKFPCKVSGAIDLAYWDAQDLVIVDWKGFEGSSSGADSLQLATYALWAVESLDCPPEKIRIYKAHLPSAELVQFRVDAQLLTAAKARILQDAERMADIHGFAHEAIAEAFSPCVQGRICVNCPFQERCYD